MKGRFSILKGVAKHQLKKAVSENLSFAAIGSFIMFSVGTAYLCVEVFTPEQVNCYDCVIIAYDFCYAIFIVFDPRVIARVLFSKQMPKDIMEHRLTGELKVKHYEGYCLHCKKKFKFEEKTKEEGLLYLLAECPKCGSDFILHSVLACPLCNREINASVCEKCGFKLNKGGVAS